ncbi:tripartite tricarboxylate transporter substrate binding protein [Salinicola lusitanus]|uniref:Tripartite tricarboxylate transporter substrate binding protein n=1 Tax=Salinicola lusitanus TaxID=1949085 RepID=A0ABZ3CY54_9GAMM|nr:tripartite tricarboxylate transporter substrate binding protein [Salinicola sp. CR57]
MLNHRNKMTMMTGLVALMPLVAQADFPDKDITIVVGYGPGGGTDITARVVGRYLEKYLDGDASVVVKNVKGAGGVIALTQVSRADPDGYTVGTFNVPASIGRMVDRKVSYDLDSFEFLSSVTSDPNTLITQRDDDIDSLEDLKQTCADGGQLTLGLAGYGGEDHFAAKQVESALGCHFTYVPLGGDGSARTALMGGHVDLAVVNVSAAYNYQDSVNFLGVMDESRSAYLQDVPTFEEQGYDIDMASTRGYVLPKGTPTAIVDQYNEAFAKMFEDPEFLKDMSREAVPAAYLDADAWKGLVEQQHQAVVELWNRDPWK